MVKDLGQASAAIEITPEMVKAGVKVLTEYNWNDELCGEEEEVRDIFLAMTLVKSEGVVG